MNNPFLPIRGQIISGFSYVQISPISGLVHFSEDLKWYFIDGPDVYECHGTLDSLVITGKLAPPDIAIQIRDIYCGVYTLQHNTNPESASRCWQP